MCTKNILGIAKILAIDYNLSIFGASYDPPVIEVHLDPDQTLQLAVNRHFLLVLEHGVLLAYIEFLVDRSNDPFFSVELELPLALYVEKLDNLSFLVLRDQTGVRTVELQTLDRGVPFKRIQLFERIGLENDNFLTARGSQQMSSFGKTEDVLIGQRDLLVYSKRSVHEVEETDFVYEGGG